jgi:hypothetical protein
MRSRCAILNSGGAIGAVKSTEIRDKAFDSSREHSAA